MKALLVSGVLSIFIVVSAVQANEQGNDGKNTSPLSYIEVGAATPKCGKGGRTPYVKNKHASKSIRVNLHVKYRYNGQAMDQDLGDWKLMPGQTKKLTSKCTIPGPTNQLFTYYAGSAVWM